MKHALFALLQESYAIADEQKSAGIAFDAPNLLIGGLGDANIAPTVQLLRESVFVPADEVEAVFPHKIWGQ